jgi:outer membrane biosynthesis protein TonB
MIAIQQQQDEPAVNVKALAWTIGVHALLLLLFFFLRYAITPAPPPVNEGGGLEVNLGTSDNGSGHDQPMSKKAPAAYQATVVYKHVAEPVVKSAIPKEIVRSTEADAPVVDNTKQKKIDKTEKPLPVVDNKKQPKTATVQKPLLAQNKPAPPEKPKYAYAGETGPGSNNGAINAPGGNEGNTHGPGDRGVPGGTPGAANYTGAPGNGTGGIGHTLTGRDINPRTFEAEFNESGKVVIHVTVDREGNIIDKRVKSSSSAQLTKVALEKLSTAHFSKSTGSEPQQFGDVTFYFKTHQ